MSCPIELGELKDRLRIERSDTARDNQLAQILDGAIASVEKWCKRQFSREALTEFYSGDGSPYVALLRTPVVSITNIWCDPNGHFGDGADGFGANTLLTEGEHYTLADDEAGLVLLIKPTGIDLDSRLYGMGTLTRRRVRRGWPRGDGNIKVSYTGGYEEWPADLKMAALEVADWVAVGAGHGGMPLQSETLGRYSYTRAQATKIASDGLVGVGELGSARSVLSRYRRLTQFC